MMSAMGQVHEAINTGGFEWADDVLDADRECSQRRSLTKKRCGICKRPVMLHCSACNVQVTACMCTIIKRMEPLEAYKMLAQQLGQTKAREAMLSYGYNMPILPNLPL